MTAFVRSGQVGRYRAFAERLRAPGGPPGGGWAVLLAAAAGAATIGLARRSAGKQS